MDLERLDTVDTSETRYFKKLRPSPVSLVSPVLSSFYTYEGDEYSRISYDICLLLLFDPELLLL